MLRVIWRAIPSEASSGSTVRELGRITILVKPIDILNYSNPNQEKVVGQAS
jgi:hypothetical protein